ncbi:pyridoxal-phosphate dependent enzyme [Candidatus Nomurabacteria bacterium]|nr:pyridoxal-phosphate dependent enzyme [Candidatus Nomurabacteria bacterium]
MLENECGETPLEVSDALYHSIGINHLKFKREDLNPTGSHKDRSLLYQISAHLQDGAKSFSISSSGNSLISAAYILKNNPKISLKIFLSKNISQRKLERLSQTLNIQIESPKAPSADINLDNIKIAFTAKPVSESIKFANQTNSILLRGSTDPYALQGPKTISYELAGRGDQIFIPTSSATTAYGIYLGYKDLLEEGEIEKIPEIHIVQSEAVNPIAREFDKSFEPKESSIISSIVDRIAHRKVEAIKAIKETGGSGWVVSDEESIKAQDLLQKAGINSSIEGAMTIAALEKATQNKYPLKNPICIITGTR